MRIFTLAQTPVATVTPTPGPTRQAVRTGSSSGWRRRQGEGYNRGVYLLDLTTRQTRQVFGSGVQFPVCPQDGKYILVSQGSSLYRTNVDGAFPVHLTDLLYPLEIRLLSGSRMGKIAAILTRSDGVREYPSFRMKV